MSVEGSSLGITDENRSKGLGTIRSPNRLVRGLRVMNALAVSPEGVPLGLVDQIYWNPVEREIPRTRVERTSRVLAGVVSARPRLDAAGVATWAVIDREGDNRDILLGLHELGRVFTVRARWDRYLWRSDEKRLLTPLENEPSLGTSVVELPRNGRRALRRAIVDVRARQVFLHFRGAALLAHPELNPIEGISKQSGAEPPVAERDAT